MFPIYFTWLQFFSFRSNVRTLQFLRTLLNIFCLVDQVIFSLFGIKRDVFFLYGIKIGIGCLSYNSP